MAFERRYSTPVGRIPKLIQIKGNLLKVDNREAINTKRS